MALVQVDDLIDAGVHYGHRSSRWNPKMRPYIYGKRNLIHIIDLRETIRGLVRAHRFLSKVASKGSLVLFVGTKRQAKECIQRESQRCFSPYVAERWIGGTFTNFRTIRNRLNRLRELEHLIRTGEINAYSKKRRSTLMRELRKIYRNLSGIRTMNRLPGAMVVVDSHQEGSAVREARKMGVPIVALIDTDSDPDKIDLAIPGNDDSIRAVDLIISRLAGAVLEGMNTLPEDQQRKIQQEYTQEHLPLTPAGEEGEDAEGSTAEPSTADMIATADAAADAVPDAEADGGSPTLVAAPVPGETVAAEVNAEGSPAAAQAAAAAEGTMITEGPDPSSEGPSAAPVADPPPEKQATAEG